MNEYCSKLWQNERGLYDLTICDGVVVVVSVENISFQRAVVMIEDYFHTRRRNE